MLIQVAWCAILCWCCLWTKRSQSRGMFSLQCCFYPNLFLGQRKTPCTPLILALRVRERKAGKGMRLRFFLSETLWKRASHPFSGHCAGPSVPTSLSPLSTKWSKMSSCLLDLRSSGKSPSCCSFWCPLPLCYVMCFFCLHMCLYASSVR